VHIFTSASRAELACKLAMPGRPDTRPGQGAHMHTTDHPTDCITLCVGDEHVHDEGSDRRATRDGSASSLRCRPRDGRSMSLGAPRVGNPTPGDDDAPFRLWELQRGRQPHP